MKKTCSNLTLVFSSSLPPVPVKGLKVAFLGKFGHPPRGRLANTEAWLEKQMSPDVIAPPYPPPSTAPPGEGAGGAGGAPSIFSPTGPVRSGGAGGTGGGVKGVKVPVDPELTALKEEYQRRLSKNPRGRMANDKEWLRGEISMAKAAPSVPSVGEQ